MELDQENNNTKKSSSCVRKQCYRDILNRIETLQENEDIGINTVKELGDIFKEVNVIDDQCPFTERVEYADETLLESVVLSSASGFLVKCIENLDLFTYTYDPAEFCSKTLNTLKNENEEFKTIDWLNIIEDARAIVPEIPNFSFLYGSFDPTKIPDPKQRKQRNKRDAQEKVEKKQLERVCNIEKDGEGVDDTVSFIRDILNNEYEENDCQPIDYFRFIIDTNDFVTAIENVFYTSFLIRDGKAKLEVGSDGACKLMPMKKRDLKSFRNDGGLNNQMIVTLTMEDWEVLRVKEGCIQKHRRLIKDKK